MERKTKHQLIVGQCPKCNKHPDWFNDVPLRAFCWGTEKNPHVEMTRVVHSKSKWMTAKEFTKVIEVKNAQTCDKCGHILTNKTRLFVKCPACKAPSPFRWTASN